MQQEVHSPMREGIEFVGKLVRESIKQFTSFMLLVIRDVSTLYISTPIATLPISLAGYEVQQITVFKLILTITPVPSLG
jgi:hypothetical protein